MYPNFNAEYARKGLTLDTLVAEMEKRDCKRSVPTMSLKLNGKAPITLNEAKVLKDVLGTTLPIEVLFSEEAI